MSTSSDEVQQAQLQLTLVYAARAMDLLQILEELRRIQTETDNGMVNGFTQKDVQKFFPLKSYSNLRRKINWLLSVGILSVVCKMQHGAAEDVFAVNVSAERLEEIREKAIRLIEAKLGEKQKYERSTKHKNWMYEKGEFEL